VTIFDEKDDKKLTGFEVSKPTGFDFSNTTYKATDFDFSKKNDKKTDKKEEEDATTGFEFLNTGKKLTDLDFSNSNDKKWSDFDFSLPEDKNKGKNSTGLGLFDLSKEKTTGFDFGGKDGKKTGFDFSDKDDKITGFDFSDKKEEKEEEPVTSFGLLNKHEKIPEFKFDDKDDKKSTGLDFLNTTYKASDFDFSGTGGEKTSTADKTDFKLSNTN